VKACINWDQPEEHASSVELPDRYCKQMNISPKSLVIVFVVLVLVLVAVDVVAGLMPAGTNWGFHHLAFFPIEAGLAVTLLMLLSLTSWFRNITATFLHDAVATISTASTLTRFFIAAIFSLVLVALFCILREQVFLLGDGHYLLRSMAKLQSSSQIPRVYPNEPMAGFLVWRIRELLEWMQLSSSHLLAYQITSILAGLCSLFVVILISKTISANSVERILFALLVFCSGSIQLFFSYVENYSATFFILLLYTYTSILYLRGKRPLIIAGTVYGLLVTFQFGMVVIGPSFLFLLAREIFRRKYTSAFVSLLAACGSFVLLLLLSGYTPGQFMARFFQGETHLLSLATASDQLGDNAFLSWRHLLNVANYAGLVSPAILVAAVLVVIGRRKIPYSDPVTVYLGISSLGGIFFILAMRSELGMSRDWDLYAPFSLPFILLILYLWKELEIDRRVSERLLISITAVTILHTLPWVLTNASENRSLQRFEVLQSPALWSSFAICNSSEELAVHYRNKEDYANAERLFQRSISIDSTNGRLWATLGNFLYLRKDLVGAERAFAASIEHGYHSFQAYYALAEANEKQDRLDQAIAQYKQALQLEPTSSATAYNLGAVLTKKNDNTNESFPYYVLAVQLDSTNALALASLGYGYFERNELDKAKHAWQKFLSLAPGSPHVAEVRSLLNQLH
jgi:tetratricopeptide (TPR) repeat protein